MNPRTVIIKLRQRLNKLSSSDYDNIADMFAVEAVNKAAIEWVRRQVHGGNAYKEGAEESRMRMDDLQFLLKPRILHGKNNKLFFESEELPKDYLYYTNILPYIERGECRNKIFKSELVEEANAPDFLSDDNWRPSFMWEQCFHTLLDNKIRVYTNADFKVQKINLVYYKKPTKMDIEGYTHEDGKESVNVDLPFKDDIAEIIIDSAAAIIAGDIESLNAQQITSQRSENNN